MSRDMNDPYKKIAPSLVLPLDLYKSFDRNRSVAIIQKDLAFRETVSSKMKAVHCSTKMLHSKGDVSQFSNITDHAFTQESKETDLCVIESMEQHKRDTNFKKHPNERNCRLEKNRDRNVSINQNFMHRKNEIIQPKKCPSTNSSSGPTHYSQGTEEIEALLFSLKTLIHPDKKRDSDKKLEEKVMNQVNLMY